MREPASKSVEGNFNQADWISNTLPHRVSFIHSIFLFHFHLFFHPSLLFILLYHSRGCHLETQPNLSQTNPSYSNTLSINELTIFFQSNFPKLLLYHHNIFFHYFSLFLPINLLACLSPLSLMHFTQ